MNISKYKVHIISIMLLLGAVLGFGQVVNFIESPSPKDGKVFVPKEIADLMPTSDSYTLGFFMYQNGFFQNLGQVDLVSGLDNEIFLGRDLLGFNGYAPGDSLITLIRNNSTTKTYGVEFNYTNNANTYRQGYDDSIVSIKKATWNADLFAGNSFLCQTDGEFDLDFPYGLRPSFSVTPSTGLEITNYAMNLINASPGTYTVTVFNEQIWNVSGFTITIKEFPTAILNRKYALCEGETQTIPTSESNVVRLPLLPTTGFTSSIPGNLYYTATHTNGCTIVDTAQVIQAILNVDNLTYVIEKEGCKNKGSIVVDGLSLSSTNPISFYSLGGLNSANGAFYGLYGGDYQIVIEDDKGCQFNLPVLEVKRNVDCEEHIIMDLNSASDFVNIIQGESVKVYDNTNKIVFSGRGPIDWKGTDDAGSFLPFGIYFMIYGDGRQKTITIIE